MFNKILSVFIVMLLSYSLLKSLYVQFIKMRCRVTGVFCAFDNPENAEIPPRMKFEYKVGDNVYYYTMANTLRLTSGENAKLDLHFRLFLLCFGEVIEPEKSAFFSNILSFRDVIVFDQLAKTYSECAKIIVFLPFIVIKTSTSELLTIFSSVMTSAFTASSYSNISRLVA